MAVDRRGFLMKAGGAAAGCAVAGLLPAGVQAAGAPPPGPAHPGKLVRVHAAGAVVGGKIAGRKKLDGAKVKAMVARALTEFTGLPDPVRALGRFVTKDDTVALKVNTLGSPGAATSPEVTFAVADLLQALGVPADRIIVYDQYASRMQKAGFRLADKAGAVRVIRHQGASAGAEDPKWGYGAETMTPAGPTRFAKVLERVTAVINLPVPKDHDLTGVTGAIKNMAYGNIDVVPKFHCNKPWGWVDGRKVAKDGSCQPECKWGACSVVRMYSAPEITSKVRLHLADATGVLYHGGPQYQPAWTVAYDSVIVATDPVALDSLFLRIVDEHRTRNGMKPLNEVARPRRRPAAFIAHGQALGLGIADPARQDYKEVELA